MPLQRMMIDLREAASRRGSLPLHCLEKQGFLSVCSQDDTAKGV